MIRTNSRRPGGPSTFPNAGSHVGCMLATTPTETPSRGAVFVWDPTGSSPGQLAHYRTAVEVPMPTPQPDLRDITFPKGGFTVRMLRPLMDYHVYYSDPSVNFSIDFEHRSVHASSPIHARRSPDDDQPTSRSVGPHYRHAPVARRTNCN